MIDYIIAPLFKFLFKIIISFCLFPIMPAVWNKYIIFFPTRDQGIPLKTNYEKAVRNNIIMTCVGIFINIISFIICLLAGDLSTLLALWGICFLITRWYIKRRISSKIEEYHNLKETDQLMAEIKENLKT